MNRFANAFRFVVCCAAVFVATTPLPARAADYFWDGGGADNSFNTPENWDKDAFPTSSDYAHVNNGQTAAITTDPPNAISRFYMGSLADTSGFIDLSGGTLTVNNDVRIGYGTNGVAVVRQTGGSLIQAATSAGYMRLANGLNSYAYYDLSGGTLEAAALLLGNSGGDGVDQAVGIFHQSAGVFTMRTTGITDPYFGIGQNSSAMGVYHLTGGTSTVENGHVRVGGTGSYTPDGQLNVSGTGRLAIEQGYMRISGVGSATYGSRPSSGTVNLGTGGTIRVPYIQAGDGTIAGTGDAHFNFHGGTLQANGNQADFLRLDSYIYGEGAKIDTAGYDLAITKSLLAPTGLGVQSISLSDGGMGYVGPPAVRITGGHGSGATAIATVSGDAVTGLTVTDPGSGYEAGDTLTATFYRATSMFPATAGTVRLAANNTSGGLEKLGEGILTLAGTNTYTGATSVRAGTLSVAGSVAGDVIVDATASLMGTGAIGGNVDLNGTLAVAYNSDTDTVDLLTTSGHLDLTGGTIRFSDTGSGTLTAGTYVFAAYGSLVGAPAATVGLLSGWSLDYAYDYNGGIDNSIALVVSPGMQIPGDANGDSKVDAADATALAQHWGVTSDATWAMGDFNKDGAVNAADASILAGNWTGSSEATAVPEPSSVAALVAGLLSLTMAAGARRRA